MKKRRGSQKQKKSLELDLWKQIKNDLQQDVISMQKPLIFLPLKEE